MPVKSRGKLFAWGAGHSGALGQGPSEDKLTPQPVPGLPEITAVYAGSASAYALDEEGQVWSWGWDAYQHLLGRGIVEYPLPMIPTVLREMGHKHTGERFEGDGGVGEPGVVEGLPAVLELAVADSNVFALTTEGEVWVWGDRAGLGIKSKHSASRPQRIEVLSNITQISASDDGLTFYALDAEQRVWSWGSGYEGELGHGKRRNDPVPKPIPSLQGVRSVHAGNSCAWALLNDGSVWFWGHGQGLELTVDNNYRIGEPLRVDALDEIVALYVWRAGCLARNSAGETFAVGALLEGVLDISFNDQLVVRAEGYDAFTHISLGDDHGLAIDATGQLFSFGEEENGALGNGLHAEDEFHPPTAVAGMANVIYCNAGNSFSFAIVSE